MNIFDTIVRALTPLAIKSRCLCLTPSTTGLHLGAYVSQHQLYYTMALLYQMYMKFFPIDLPPSGTFQSQTAVVTGGTSGLGLAAAIHLINLDASEVIISSRNTHRAQAALATIEKETGGKSKGKVRVLELDMESYDSVRNFAGEVANINKGKGGVDIVILNAGVAGVEPKVLGEGWNDTIQVNTLSTILLAALLLPRMKVERAKRQSAANLSIVGSINHTRVDITPWASWVNEKQESVLEHLSKPENWRGPSDIYDASKLMAQYGFNELAERATGSNGRPQVIMNTMCPGAVATDLPRYFVEKSIVFVIAIVIFFGLFGKSPSNGARTYMAAVTTSESEHGKFIQFFKSEQQMKKLSEKVTTSKAGIRMQAQIWEEITRELMTKVPESSEMLQAA
ncbi:hypothetical protein BX600DRAFT_545980 [Xylariales sp. PMI_506]|nr:hypothetical protein BX600DRAFT_545980 [Xylariales sp. PMI_506]